jgi:hypothetical protein
MIKKKWLDNLIGTTLASLCILAATQCGSNNNASKTLIFKTTPNPSIVIESDYVNTVVSSTGTLKEVYKGPWTNWSYEVTNITTSTITIYTIHYEGSAKGITFKGDLTGADNKPTPTDVMFTLSPGETTTGQIVIHDLPPREASSSLNYFFFAKSVGWYGPANKPEKSFKSTFSFRASE